jgi:hypothetical protein
MSHDPESIRRLTLSARYLRGLEQIPVALVFFGMGAADVFDFAWSPIIFVALFALAVPAILAINRYYDRRFGVVKAPARSIGRTWAIMLIAFFILQPVSALFALPVQLGFLALGLAVAVHALRNFRLEGQRLLVAIFLVFISVWPPITVPWENEHWRVTAQFGFAAVCIVMGIWDHRALVKAFERARPAEMDQVSLGSR